MSGFIVQIIKYSDCSVFKTLGPYQSESQADKAEAGVDANLNHEDYYSVVSPSSRPDFGPSKNGSSRCKSGSIASGGTKTYCSCGTCF